MLVAQPGCGGAERVTILFGKILESNGYSVDVELIKTASDKNTTLLPFIPNHWSVNLDSCKFRKQIFVLLRYIWKSNPDIIFVSQGYYNLMVLALKRLGFISTKVVIRDNNMPSVHGKWQLYFSRFLFRTADAIIAQTEEMKIEMAKFYDVSLDKITVIHNPIDKILINEKLEAESVLQDGLPQYIYCGRIAEQKDLMTLVKAFKLVKGLMPNSKLWIIGEGSNADYADSIYHLVDSLNLNDDVVFLGYKTNPYIYIKSADVFVLSSIYEGLPNVLLEAMYIGKPVAVTESIPFISQIIKDGENGYKCSIKDPDALAAAMLKAYEIKNIRPFGDLTKGESKILDLFNSLSSKD